MANLATIVNNILADSGINDANVAVITGSNQFSGSQTITGSLTVTGQITAQTLNVQQVTSSIVYSSGSNIFGNSLSDTQQLTGSVSVTGSMNVNGTPVSVGTGSAGQVAFWDGTNSITSDTGLVYNNTTKVLTLNTNTTTNATAFVINNALGTPILTLTSNNLTSVNASFGNTSVNTLTSTTVVQVGFSSFIRFGGSGGSGRSVINSFSNGTITLLNNAQNDFTRLHFGGNTNTFPAIQKVGNSLAIVDATGATSTNLLIGTTTNSGFRLDVNGTARVSGNTQVIGSFTVTTGSAVELQVTNTGVNIGSATIDTHNVTGSLLVSGSTNIVGNTVMTGSLTVTGGITGSLHGTASWAENATTASFATNAISASFATTASYALDSDLLDGQDSSVFATTGSNQFSGSQTITGSLTVTGQITAQTLNVQQVTSSIVYSSGSNIFGNSLSDTQQLTGSVSVTGSLTVNNTPAILGSLTSGQVAFGTAANTVGGSANLTYISEALVIQSNSAIPLTLSRGIVSGLGSNLILRNTDNTNLGAEIAISFSHRDTGTTQINSARISSVIEGRGSGVVSSSIRFYTSNNDNFPPERWRMTFLGVLQSNGAQTIQTSTGNLTLATGGGNGNILLTPNGTGVPGDFRVLGRFVAGALNSTGDSHFGSSGIGGTPTFGGQDYGSYMSHNAFRQSDGAWKHSRVTTIGASKIQVIGGGSNGLAGGFYFDYSPNVGSSNISWSTLMYLTSTGNLLLNTTTDAGFRLDVNGTARIQGNLNVSTGGITLTGAQTIQTSTGNLTLATAAGNGNIVLTPNGTGNVIIGTANYGRKLNITGNGITIDNGTGSALLELYSTVDYRLQASDKFIIFDVTSTASRLEIFSSGNVSIGGTSDAGFRLDVNGTARVSGNTQVTGSFTVITGSAVELQVTNLGVNIGSATTDTHNVTGSLRVSGSMDLTGNARVSGSSVFSGSVVITGTPNTSTSSSLVVYGSGSAQPVFTVQGSQGELFSITDSLSGSLFSVNDISGLPILEVFSNGDTLIGDYTAPAVYTTRRVASTTAGVNVIYSLATSSYDGVFVDYTIRSGSVGRAGNFMAMWSGSSTDFTDTSINGFGTTSNFVFGASISGSNLIVSGSGSTAGWTVKTIIRGI